MHLFFDRNEEKTEERTEKGKQTNKQTTKNTNTKLSSNTKKLLCVLPLESCILLVLKQAVYIQGRRESRSKIDLVPTPTCNLGKSGCTKHSWQLLWFHHSWRAMSLDQQWHYRLQTQMQGKIMTDLEPPPLMSGKLIPVKLLAILLMVVLPLTSSFIFSLDGVFSYKIV